MRSMLLAAALAVGFGLPSAYATDKLASAGNGATGPAAVPLITTIGKAIEPAQITPADPAAAQAVSPTETPAAAATAEKPKPPAPPSLVARINLSTQRMEVSVHGASVHSWAISSGRAGFETPRGSFKPQWVAKMWYSRKYDLAPMPHAVFINGGVAVHATSSTGMLGQPASHGCIRLAPGHAATFYGLVQKHGLGNARVQVFGTPPAPRVARAPERGIPTAGTARVPNNQVVAGSGGPPGMVHLRPGSPAYGAASFEHNGVRYVRVR